MFTEDVEVRGATKDEATFLEIPIGEPVYEVLRTAIDAEDRKVEACTRPRRETVAADVPMEAGSRGDIPRHSVSVTAIVTREDGRVLVIKRDDDGRWVPPAESGNWQKHRRKPAPARCWRKPATA